MKLRYKWCIVGISTGVVLLLLGFIFYCFQHKWLGSNLGALGIAALIFGFGILLV